MAGGFINDKEACQEAIVGFGNLILGGIWGTKVFYFCGRTHKAKVHEEALSPQL